MFKKVFFVLLVLAASIEISADNPSSDFVLQDPAFPYCDRVDCKGYQYAEIRSPSLGGVYDTADIPLPLGSNPSSIIPKCMIHSYDPASDDDMGWTCDHSFITKDGEDFVRFSLDLHHENNDGRVEAFAVVIDTNEFELVDYAEFRIYDDDIEYYDLYTPSSTFIIRAVSSYYTNKDDNFQFDLGYDSGSELYFAQAENGNSGSYIEGGFYVFRSLGQDAFICGGWDTVDCGSCYFKWDSTKNNVKPDSCAEIPSNRDQEPVLLASLYSYDSGGDMDFGVYLSELLNGWVEWILEDGKWTKVKWGAMGIGNHGSDESKAKYRFLLFGYYQ